MPRPRAFFSTDTFLAVGRRAPELGTVVHVADVGGAGVAFHASTRFIRGDTFA